MHHLLRSRGLAAITAAGLLLLAASASAQSVAATANATILQALTLTEDVELDYGRIVSSAAPGTATVTQGGAQSCAGGTTCVGAHTAAQFTVTGTANETVDVTVDAAYSLAGPGPAMGATSDAPLSVLIGGGGSSTFNVGGTLSVAASQTNGTYSGTYNISVAYQ